MSVSKQKRLFTDSIFRDGFALWLNHWAEEAGALMITVIKPWINFLTIIIPGQKWKNTAIVGRRAQYAGRVVLLLFVAVSPSENVRENDQKRYYSTHFTVFWLAQGFVTPTLYYISASTPSFPHYHPTMVLILLLRIINLFFGQFLKNSDVFKVRPEKLKNTN